ncbi:MAG: putative oxidoreductase C-terminal domain-containing protein [Chitinophagaceae bacterium]
MNNTRTLSSFVVAATAILFAGCQSNPKPVKEVSKDSTMVKLITLDPGHFHAALVQKSMYPGIDSIVHVYAPDGPELQSHLALVNSYNTRKENPTLWKEEIYKGTDYLEKMLSEKKGNVVVVAGNNKQKSEYIHRTVDAGMNLLGDKPMAIDTTGFKDLVQAFKDAESKKVLLYDIMTERSEITNLLQKELSRDTNVFGKLQTGTPESPAVIMESVHHFYKFVSGSALKRPAWFFDAGQQGNAIVDVATHLVDLVQWECFPDIPIDYLTDIKIHHAKKWPAPLTLSQFREITKMDSFPTYLRSYIVKDTVLNADANGSVNYSIKGINIRVAALWNYKAPEGTGDTHYAKMMGTKCSLVVKQGKEDNNQPTLYIDPAASAGDGFENALAESIKNITVKYPGVTIEKSAKSWKVVIPEKYKIGHEAHFGQVMERFLQYLKDGKLPEWEVPCMLAKYYVTTYGSAMAEKSKK